MKVKTCLILLPHQVFHARKEMIDLLRPFFSSIRNEIIDLFYAITDCHGWIRNTHDKVIVRLETLEQPRRRAIQEQLCRKLTALGTQTPTGKWLIVEVGSSPLKN